MSKSFFKRNWWLCLLIMIMGFLIFASSFFTLGDDSLKFRATLHNSSNEELMERGRDYYRQNHMDSALIIFTYIGDSFDEKLSDQEKRLALLAKNNVGIIYSFEYMDYPRGYATLSEAFEMADAPGFEDTQAVLAHNIVEVLRLYRVCLRSDNANERIADYLNLGVEKAVIGKEFPCLASMVINALQSDLSTPVNNIKAIESSEIPDTIEGVKYAQELLRAARLYQKGNSEESRNALYSAFQRLPAYSKPFQYIIGYKRAVAQTYAAEKNYEMAEKLGLEALEIADSINSLDDRLHTLAFLSDLPTSRKDLYSTQLMQVKDSAISNGQLQMVSEIEFIRSLAKEREENKKLAEQRTRLYWSLSIGGVLVVIFTVLIGLLVRNTHRLRERNASLYEKIQVQLASGKPPVSKLKNIDKTALSENPKYAGSSLSQEKMNHLQSRLTELLNNEEWLCDPDVSLGRTAGELGVNTTYLSRTVNERFGMSFSALLNEYRVPIATRHLSKHSPYANHTIESIARAVGYSSRSAFIAAFKKINGMTPSEYIKCQNAAESRS